MVHSAHSKLWAQMVTLLLVQSAHRSTIARWQSHNHEQSWLQVYNNPQGANTWWRDPFTSDLLQWV